MLACVLWNASNEISRQLLRMCQDTNNTEVFVRGQHPRTTHPFLISSSYDILGLRWLGQTSRVQYSAECQNTVFTICVYVCKDTCFELPLNMIGDDQHLNIKNL